MRIKLLHNAQFGIADLGLGEMEIPSVKGLSILMTSLLEEVVQL